MSAPAAAGAKLTAALLNSAPVTLSTLTTGSVTNTVTETTIGSLTIPAGDATTGARYKMWVIGSADSAAGTATLALRLRLTGPAGLIVVTVYSATPRLGTNEPWWTEIDLIFTNIGATGNVQIGGFACDKLTAGNTAIAGLLNNVPGTAVDTTQPVVLAITAAFGTAAVGNTARTAAGGLLRA